MIQFKLQAMIKKRGHIDKSYRQIADEMGVDHVSLWKMLNGKPYNPSLEMINKLCAYLKCQPGNILKFKRG